MNTAVLDQPQTALAQKLDSAISIRHSVCMLLSTHPEGLSPYETGAIIERATDYRNKAVRDCCYHLLANGMAERVLENGQVTDPVRVRLTPAGHEYLASDPSPRKRRGPNSAKRTPIDYPPRAGGVQDMDALRALQREMQGLTPPTQQQETPPAPMLAPMQATPAPASSTPAPIASTDPLPSLQRAIDSLVDVLVGEAVARLRVSLSKTLYAAVDDEIANALGYAKQQSTQTAQTTITTSEAPNTSGKKRLPRVTVVGLLPGQARMIEGEFSRSLDLHFVSSDESNSARILSLASTSTRMLAMTNFISHQHEDAIKRGGGNLERISGGMSTLRAALMRAASAAEAVS